MVAYSAAVSDVSGSIHGLEVPRNVCMICKSNQICFGVRVFSMYNIYEFAKKRISVFISLV